MTSSELASTAKGVLRDCSKYAIFDASGAVLAANYQVGVAFADVQLIRKLQLLRVYEPILQLLQPSQSELQALTRVLDDRENAIRNGLVIDGQRYEVGTSNPATVPAGPPVYMLTTMS